MTKSTSVIFATGAAIFAYILVLVLDSITASSPDAAQAQENTSSEDAAFAAKVEQALLDNPEILLKAFQALEAGQQSDRHTQDLQSVADLADDLFAGLDLSKPILIKFQDYNCGYCRQAHRTVETLLLNDPDTQVVRLETPILGASSQLAAEVALTIKIENGEDAYTRVASALMDLPGTADLRSVRDVLSEQGFDPDAVLQSARNGTAVEELARAASLARSIGATGTPVFVGPSGIERGATTVETLRRISHPNPS